MCAAPTASRDRHSDLTGNTWLGYVANRGSTQEAGSYVLRLLRLLPRVRLLLLHLLC